jgi:ribose-phosphate pyrophosphokinase
MMMRVISGTQNTASAENIAGYCSTRLCNINISRFADQEVYVEIHDNIRGHEVFIVQSTLGDHNLMELMVIIDACKRASVKEITAVIPYFGYARQDRKPRSRTPVSAKLVADLLQAAGANRIVTVDLHAGQIQGFFNIPVDDLTARNLFVQDMREHNNLDSLCIVSPDAGGAVRARHFAKKLNNCPMALIDKRREEHNKSQVMNVIGDVEGKHCIIVDDIADTCGTLINCADALKEKGAESVRAYITHGVLSAGAEHLIAKSDSLDELVISNSIEKPKDVSSVSHTKVRQISLDELLGEAVRRVYNNESVSSLFEVIGNV